MTNASYDIIKEELLPVLKEALATCASGLPALVDVHLSAHL